MQDHLKGLVITGLGVLCLVPDSLFVRLVEADALAIAFWRGLVAGCLLALFVLVRMGARAFEDVLRAGWQGHAYILLYGLSAPGFVLAVSLTSVANVVFILASMPVFAAVFSRLTLGEPISARMIWTMLGVFLGLAILIIGSKENAATSLAGDLVALGVSACYAGALTAVRGVRARSMVPAAPIALIGMSVLLLPFVDVLAPVAEFWPLLIAHGAFIAFASGLMVLGPRYIGSAEVSLLILLETVLAPLLVWAVIGEDPGVWALVGGGVVIAVLLLSNMVVLLRLRAI